MNCSPPGSSVHGTVLARILGNCSFLQGIFPTQGSNLNLLHWQVDFFFFNTEPPRKPNMWPEHCGNRAQPSQEIRLLPRGLGEVRRKPRSLCRHRCGDPESVKGQMVQKKPGGRIMRPQRCPLCAQKVPLIVRAKTIHEVSRDPEAEKEKGGQGLRVRKDFF